MSAESNRLLLKHHLEKLRLPTMRRDWEALASTCSKEGRDYADFLWQLCERELIEREQRAAQRRVKSAKFPVIKTLDAFDFNAQPTSTLLTIWLALSHGILDSPPERA